MLADEAVDVTAQHLATRGELGYVVTDLVSPLSAGSLERLRGHEHCVWAQTWEPE